MQKGKNYLVPIGTTLLFSILFAIAIFNVFFRSKIVTGRLIADDVANITLILKRIHQTCGIIDFDYQKNPINFLNVGSFESSEVGPMNLTYPKKWQGPYLDDNLTMQDKEYQVVYTKKGYFVTPGDGVKLPNGKIIGVDILLDENADIDVLSRDVNGLMFEGKALAAPLNLGKKRFIFADPGA